MIRVGVAGWDYDDWWGPVYPDPAPLGFDPLAWLAGWFPLLEVNSTFYRPATAKTVRSWMARVSGQPDFRFTAKVWRRFTHERRAFDAADVRAARSTSVCLRTFSPPGFDFPGPDSGPGRSPSSIRSAAATASARFPSRR